MITIRPLTTLDDCRRVAALERRVWGYTDEDEVVPPAFLIVSIRRGGILLGAFDARDELRGFVYSVPGMKDGRPMQWSHLLGVLPDAQHAGLGRRLKLAQRDAALAMGLDLIEWTFDPLQAVNAHFNARLGVVVSDYEENFYGESGSPLHGGTPTDRFIAAWRITTPHVERRIASAGMPMVRDSRVLSAPVLNPSRAHGGWLAPGAADLTHDGPRLLVEIPVGLDRMLADEPSLALDWRLSTRHIFQTLFARGYRIVDFLLAHEAGRGQYLLDQGPGNGGQGPGVEQG